MLVAAAVKIIRPWVLAITKIAKSKSEPLTKSFAYILKKKIVNYVKGNE